MFCKEEEEGGLTPADDDDAAKRKINRKEFNFLVGDQYNRFINTEPPPVIAGGGSVFGKGFIFYD